MDVVRCRTNVLADTDAVVLELATQVRLAPTRGEPQPALVKDHADWISASQAAIHVEACPRERMHAVVLVERLCSRPHSIVVLVHHAVTISAESTVTNLPSLTMSVP